MKACVFLHCAPYKCPYRIHNFCAPFSEFDLKKEVGGIGPFQMNHMWLVKFRTPAARERILKKGSLQVKGHFCAVIDTVHQDVRFKVHWVPFDIPGECRSRALSDFGGVKSVKHDAWAANGFETAESTTRLIQMTLRPDVHAGRTTARDEILERPGDCRRAGTGAAVLAVQAHWSHEARLPCAPVLQVPFFRSHGRPVCADVRQGGWGKGGGP
ncbi:hypothetical protein HPB48_023559 [Haemaphysalis longicornis]|uniref:Uncharacterized protein n=1 Tax=Haemaphysalis longicornis TaxID=44386 RepID=A0A9J6GWR9_HAELO|nr:hypothetical protein HPB48_023559 [Haemaphysalis longicornis]